MRRIVKKEGRYDKLLLTAQQWKCADDDKGVKAMPALLESLIAGNRKKATRRKRREVSAEN